MRINAFFIYGLSYFLLFAFFPKKTHSAIRIDNNHVLFNQAETHFMNGQFDLAETYFLNFLDHTTEESSILYKNKAKFALAVISFINSGSNIEDVSITYVNALKPQGFHTVLYRELFGKKKYKEIISLYEKIQLPTETNIPLEEKISLNYIIGYSYFSIKRDKECESFLLNVYNTSEKSAVDTLKFQSAVLLMNKFLGNSQTEKDSTQKQLLKDKAFSYGYSALSYKPFITRLPQILLDLCIESSNDNINLLCQKALQDTDIQKNNIFMLRLAHLMCSKENYKDAYELYLKTGFDIDKNTGTSSDLLSYGICLHHVGKIEESIAVFEKIIAVYEESEIKYIAFYNLITSYYLQKNYTKAFELLNSNEYVRIETFLNKELSLLNINSSIKVNKIDNLKNFAQECKTLFSSDTTYSRKLDNLLINIDIVQGNGCKYLNDPILKRDTDKYIRVLYSCAESDFKSNKFKEALSKYETIGTIPSSNKDHQQIKNNAAIRRAEILVERTPLGGVTEKALLALHKDYRLPEQDYFLGEYYFKIHTFKQARIHLKFFLENKNFSPKRIESLKEKSLLANMYLIDSYIVEGNYDSAWSYLIIAKNNAINDTYEALWANLRFGQLYRRLFLDNGKDQNDFQNSRIHLLRVLNANYKNQELTYVALLELMKLCEENSNLTEANRFAEEYCILDQSPYRSLLLYERGLLRKKLPVSHGSRALYLDDFKEIFDSRNIPREYILTAAKSLYDHKTEIDPQLYEEVIAYLEDQGEYNPCESFEISYNELENNYDENNLNKTILALKDLKMSTKTKCIHTYGSICYILGYLAYSMGDYSEAISNFQLIEISHPKYSISQKHLAEITEKQEMYKDAATHFKNYIESLTDDQEKMNAVLEYFSLFLRYPYALNNNVSDLEQLVSRYHPNSIYSTLVSEYHTIEVNKGNFLEELQNVSKNDQLNLLFRLSLNISILKLNFKMNKYEDFISYYESEPGVPENLVDEMRFMYGCSLFHINKIDSAKSVLTNLSSTSKQDSIKRKTNNFLAENNLLD